MDDDTEDEEVVLWDYPQLAKLCYGVTARGEARSGVRVWDPEYSQWFYRAPDASILADEGHSFMVIRHAANKCAPRLGYFLDLLERETKDPVGVCPAYSDPSGLLTHQLATARLLVPSTIFSGELLTTSRNQR